MSLIAGCSEVSSEKSFYEDADKYWKTIPANVNGMLGGYSQISSVDISGSHGFIQEFIQGPNARLNRDRALDCGAGIGRVSKHFLLDIFNTVDLLEQNAHFLQQARTYLGPKLSSRVGEYISCGLQDVVLKSEHYNVIWIQWVTGHLTDAHFVNFLKRCQKALTTNGLVFVKENLASSEVEWDGTDSSVTRTYEQMHNIFEQASMQVVKEAFQTDLPSELYRVNMVALRSNS